jgi:hypothetical protein
MRKKVVVLSIICLAVLLLASASSAVVVKPSKNQMIPVEVTWYGGQHPRTDISLVAEDKLEEIRQCLTELSKAYESGDWAHVRSLESSLQEYGLLTKGTHRLPVPLGTEQLLQNPGIAQFFKGPLDDNISNSMCLFTALGDGILLGGFTYSIIQALFDVLRNQTRVIPFFVLLILFLPIIALCVVVNVFIPIRILMRSGFFTMRNGTVSSIGAMGSKRMTVGADPVEANISGFTGLSLTIPKTNITKGFCFICGFAVKVEAIV